MNWVDAHCHLERGDYPDALPYIERARAAGLVHAVIVGQLQGPGNFGDALAVARAHPEFLSPTMGIHPHDAAKATEADFAELERLCALPEMRAVGEAGLDYYYDRSPRDVQREVFVRQCLLARKLDKPLVVHVRDAHEDCAEVLRETGINNAVIHCFTGDLPAARTYLDLGLLLSISGVLTYKKTEGLQEAVRFAPLDRLMVETDSPFLAPVPYRGKRNEPSFVTETGKKMAELKAVSLEQVAEATTANSSRFFKLPTRE